MAKKRITVENMADRFGPRYKESTNETNLEYLVELGVSSGLKTGYNTEEIIANALTGFDSERPSANVLLEGAQANTVLLMQIREVGIKQCRLLEAILREAKQ